jgi:hypothetical protein
MQLASQAFVLPADIPFARPTSIILGIHREASTFLRRIFEFVRPTRRKCGYAAKLARSVAKERLSNHLNVT